MSERGSERGSDHERGVWGIGGGEGSLDEGERGVGRQEVADAKVVKVGAGGQREGGRACD